MSSPVWKANIFTLFPEMFPGILGAGLASKSYAQKLWDYQCINFREYATDRHKTVDDVPYGGGAGMVIKPDVIGAAIDANVTPGAPIYYLSPRGQKFDMKMAEKFVAAGEVNLVCGRYEGLDQRVIDHYQMVEVSIGDYILSGGEQAAQIIMDACIRLIPESLGNDETHMEESFVGGLLEYPHYTRPAMWRDCPVPDVLTSGHHEKIKAWRMMQAEKITQERRPDLWAIYKDKNF